MSANVKHDPTWVLKGLRNNNPLQINFFYYHIRSKARKLIRCAYPDDPQDWLEDCFSMAFLTILEKIQNGSYVDDNLNAFALQVIRFTYSNLRRKWLPKTMVTDPIIDDYMMESDTTFPAPNNVGELFEYYQKKRHARWYKRLSKEQKGMLDLRMRGWDYRDIATEVGMAHGTVRNKFPKLLEEAKRL